MERVKNRLQHQRKKFLFRCHTLTLCTNLRRTLPELTVKDDELKLCTLAPNKVKDSVVYPPKFTGKETEDVYSFIKEFRQAIASDHVKKADEVKKLRNYLDGH